MTAADAGAGPLSVIHMGGRVGLISAPIVTVSEMLQGANEPPRGYKLGVALDEVWKAATLPANLDGYLGSPAPEVVAGEHVRQNLARVRIFSVSQ